MPLNERQQARLNRIRQIAQRLNNGVEQANEGLKNIPGVNKKALSDLLKGKQDLLNHILTTEPPPELQRFLEDVEDNP